MTPAFDDAFVRIDATWSSKRALEIIDALQPLTHVIVHRRGDQGDRFYAFALDEIEQELADAGDHTVEDALALDERLPSPVIGVSHAPVERTSIVVEDGLLLGVAPRRTRGNPRRAVQLESTRGVQVFRNGGPLVPPPAGSPATAPGTRSLVARGPEEVQVGKTGAVRVTLAIAAVAGAPQLAAATGETVHVAIETSGAIEPAGADEVPIVLEDAGDEGARFEVRGKEIGEGKVKVLAYLQGRVVARAILTVQVVAAQPEKIEVQATATVISVQSPPDLTLRIKDAGGSQYNMEVTTSDSDLGLYLSPFGPVTLGQNPEAYFADFYTDVEGILRAGSTPATKIERLEALGSSLADRLIPPPLAQRLADLRARIRSIEILSAEPWVPWELCWLTGLARDGDAGGFLSEAFQTTRWFAGEPQFPSLTARSIALVVPQDSGLPQAPRERDLVQGLATAGRTVTEIPAEYLALRKMLKTMSHDVLHFTGHGEAHPGDADQSAMVLEGGERFEPRDLSGGEVKKSFGAQRPIVLLNACEVGRAGLVLGTQAGWPLAFVKAGAGAFVGALWKVGDNAAAGFAKALYEALLTDGTTVGDAVHRARLSVRRASDPTWLAYVAYAHPSARVKAA